MLNITKTTIVAIPATPLVRPGSLSKSEIPPATNEQVYDKIITQQYIGN
jgi:hypothetical protein